MAYQLLGPYTKKGALDPNNPLGVNFYTVTFTAQDVPLQVEYEVYHVFLTGQVGATFQWWLGNYPWSANLNGWYNEWDPAQPMEVIPGQTIYFYFSYGSGGTVPVVTIWTRSQSTLV